MTIDQLLLKINKFIINPFLAFLFVLAGVYFLYGLVRYFLAGESEADRTTGRRHMLWGIIGMFLMVSVFGILRVIVGTFGIDPASFGASIPSNTAPN